MTFWSFAFLAIVAISAQRCPEMPSMEQIRDIHRKDNAPSSVRWEKDDRRSEEFPQSRLLQVVSPPPPREKEWVMVAGNETQVDSVLSISLGFGGRLASIGNFVHNKMINYYAIMHTYPGPVFIKPGPMSHQELITAVRENQLRDLALVQVCGQEIDGKVSYMTYWEHVPGVEMEVWFPGSKHSEAQKKHFEEEGMRLTWLCGFAVKGQARYVGVWMKRSLSYGAYEAHYGIQLEQCLVKNAQLAQKQYVARHLNVFQLGAQLMCAGIWERAIGHRHYIRVGRNLIDMSSEFISDPSIIPRQISHYFSSPTETEYVVLWSDLETDRYPNPAPLWATGDIPSHILPGSSSLLRPNEFSFIVHRIESFMRSYDLPGLSIAIAKDERLKFAGGFGYSDVRRREIASPHSLFRVGSVSKPITAAAIMMLLDKNLLDINVPLFGPNRLFGMEYATNGKYGKYVTDVTTRHLLEHTTGGWDNEDGDLAWSMPKENPPSLCRKVLSMDLPGPPGRKWVYSNFGYLLLGQIIEKLSSMSYEQFVHSAVLSVTGAKDAFVARGTIAEKKPNEAMYYMSGTSIGFDPYDILPPERIGPWGGWVANPIQLLKFLASVDGAPVKRDIISPQAIIQWSTPSVPSNRSYGLGWSINVMGFNGWQHDGRMPGSSAMLVRLASGHSIAVATNKEFVEREFFHDMAYMMHHLVHQCEWWNEDTDLFPAN